MKVEDGNDLQVGAPMKGEVLDIKVAMGEVVEKGQGKYQMCFYSSEDVFCFKMIWILLESYNKINILILVVAVMSAMKMEMAVQVSYFIENEQIVSN